MWDKHKKSGSNILYYPLLPPQDRYERPPFLPPFLTLFIYMYPPVSSPKYEGRKP